MKLSEIKELIELMKDTTFTELEIEKDNFRFCLKNQKETMIQPILQQPVQQIQDISVTASEVQEQEAGEKKIEIEGTLIKAPIVGTFYASPSPDAQNFVKIGQAVAKGDVLCIIEAMKLMNEIESDVSGEVVEVFVENEQMVEYGQPLFKIKTK